jgi:hypothetical protein
MTCLCFVSYVLAWLSFIRTFHHNCIDYIEIIWYCSLNKNMQLNFHLAWFLIGFQFCFYEVLDLAEAFIVIKLQLLPDLRRGFILVTWS